MRRDPGQVQEVGRQSKIQRVVDGLGVKLHRFSPSGTEIWTVVGSECDFLVDFIPKMNRNVYCACYDFHFRVTSGKVTECYHLAAARTALREGMYSVIEFNDEEMVGFLEALLGDIFANIS
ncbi:MAG: hypothetical protein JRN15_22690 [Nitrososphaerota archaeon]|nr:hypothetical protein [Nitrososphaerota archaeon]